MLLNRFLNKQNIKFLTSMYLLIFGIIWIGLHIVTRFSFKDLVII